jgi:acetophenone carboxylase
MPIPTDTQKLQCLKPAVLSEGDKKALGMFKPGEYEIGFERINNILDESKTLFVRSCRSNLGSAGDLMTCISSAQGDLSNTACGTYLHAVIQPAILKFILQNYQENPGINDGDIWFANDALYGGIHNPDEVVHIPIFHEGRLLGWAGAAVHTPETGAVEPGGMAVRAQSRFEEGMNFPPMRIGENHELRNDSLELMTAFGIRQPHVVIVDLKAKVVAASRIRTRILEMVEDKGVDFVKALLDKMVVIAEEVARKRIRSFPDGKFRCVNFMDGVGFEEGLVRLSYLTLHKKDDKITLDFTGTGPEQPYAYNSHVTSSVGHVSNFVYEYIFHDLPISSGSFGPIDFVFPRGSVLNPGERAATSCAVEGAIGLMCGVHNCFGKMMMPLADGHTQVAASQGNIGTGWGAAGTTQWGLPFADVMAYSLNTEGQGGRVNQDGIDSFGFAWCVFGRAPNVEEVENEFPMLIPVSSHWTDSCGHGKYRGGVGTIQICVSHGTPDIYHFAYSGNSKFQPQQPMYGGYLPPTEPGIDVTGADIMEQMAAGELDLKLDFRDLLDKRKINGQWNFRFLARDSVRFDEGDIITFAFSVGGAGYGDPLDRDPELVVKDVKLSLISKWSAENIYHVSYDEERFKVNVSETNDLRARERQSRLERSTPYDEFIDDWLKQSPPEEALKYYGSWPDAEVINPIIRL